MAAGEHVQQVDEGTQTNGVNGISTGNIVTNEPWSVESGTTSPIPFFHLLQRLKTTQRTGWVRFGIKHSESISDHMYRMSICTWMAPSHFATKMNMDKCGRMALVHDMAEALVGDITPVDPVVDKAEKSRRESATMDWICDELLKNVDSAFNAREIRKLWQEYEDGETQESLFVHDIDKIELILQMVEYERSHKCEVDLGEFTWVRLRIQSDDVDAWAEQLFVERMKLWKKYGKEPQWAEGVKPTTA